MCSWGFLVLGQNHPTEAADHDGTFERELQVLRIEVGGMMSQGPGGVEGAERLLQGVGVAGAVLPL